ncbi:uncharacterized protein LOC128862502 [Anastrepha ludens]|uniref:uncharacterized protein LOC128862502 n=1 Tax=Anastrepha ludens TaxID=28586 RepID=UPI0023AF82E9|nr:uncharacterized protein LOC128862502 [Anastrepha ludens]
MKTKAGKTSESSGTSSNYESDPVDTEGCNFGLTPIELPYLWYPNQESVNHLEYVRRLECEFTCLQRAFLALTTQFARLQFRVRQIVQAEPCEREALLLDLERVAFNGDEDSDELPRIQRDSINMGDVRHKQSYILERLRQQLGTLSEAQSWQPVPELDAAPPAQDSVDEVTCCCIRKKRKPPPTPETATDQSAFASSAESSRSRSSSPKTETGVGSESDGEKARNGTISITTPTTQCDFCDETSCAVRKPRICYCNEMYEGNKPERDDC